MKHEMILSFQKLLFEKLTNDANLMKIVNGIYSYVPKDTKFPYIHIGKIVALDWSTKNSQGIQLLININIFSKTHGSKEILEILFLLNNLLDKAEIIYQNKYCINLNLITSDVEQQAQNFQAISRFKVKIEESS